jgi:hypothetical protein
MGMSTNHLPYEANSLPFSSLRRSIASYAKLASTLLDPLHYGMVNSTDARR